MSFLVNRAQGYTSFISRKIDLSKSLVINQSSKLSLVENDLSLTVIRIKMDKFINRGLLNDCFFSLILNLSLFARIFLGRLIQTGPLLGDIANLNASLKVFGIFLGLLTVQVFFVTGLNKDSWSRP